MNRQSYLDDQLASFAAKADCNDEPGYLQFPSQSALRCVRQRLLRGIVFESAPFSGAMTFFFLDFTMINSAGWQIAAFDRSERILILGINRSNRDGSPQNDLRRNGSARLPPDFVPVGRPVFGAMEVSAHKNGRRLRYLLRKNLCGSLSLAGEHKGQGDGGLVQSAGNCY
jgi:hypothetical protein